MTALQPWASRVALAAAVALSMTTASVAQRTVDQRWQSRYADRLPLFCKYTQKLPDNTPGAYGDPVSRETYAPMFGDSWENLHHYCRGLWYISDAVASARVEDRVNLYAQSIREFNYVLERASPEMILVPEILVKRGSAQMALGRYLEAVDDFTAVISTAPRYDAGYLALSEYFERFGDPDRAAMILRQGLELVPDSGLLRSSLDRLESSAADGGGP